MYKLLNITVPCLEYLFQRKILNQSVTCLYKNALSKGRQYSRNTNHENNSEQKKSKEKKLILSFIDPKLNIGELINLIGVISIPIMLYYLDKKQKDYEERNKVIKELYSHIKSFISMYEEKEGQFIDFDITQQIGQEVISTIVHRKDLQEHIQKYFIDYYSEYIYFLKIVLYITREFLYHYHNIENVEQILSFVINNILENDDNLHKVDPCLKLVSEIYYQYAKILEFSNKIPESLSYFKKAQSIIQEHSYIQIHIEHVLNRIELNNIKQEIKNLNIQYNQKVNKFELLTDVDKSKVEKLIKDNAAYIMKYEILKANNQLYVLNDYVKKKVHNTNRISPTSKAVSKNVVKVVRY